MIMHSCIYRFISDVSSQSYAVIDVLAGLLKSAFTIAAVAIAVVHRGRQMKVDQCGQWFAFA